jgi:hypothetical protein
MVGSKDASMPEMAGASLAPIASNGQVKLLLSRDRRQSFERRERDVVIASSSAVTMTCDSELGARSLLGSIGRARRSWRPNQIQSLRNAELSADVSIHFPWLNAGVSIHFPCRVRQVLRKRLFSISIQTRSTFPWKLLTCSPCCTRHHYQLVSHPFVKRELAKAFHSQCVAPTKDSVCQQVTPRVTAAVAHCRLTIRLVKRACCCSFMYL